MTMDELDPMELECPVAYVEEIDPRQKLKDDLWNRFRCEHLGFHEYTVDRVILGPDEPENIVVGPCIHCGHKLRYSEIAIKLDTVTEKHGRGLSSSIKCIVEPVR